MDDLQKLESRISKIELSMIQLGIKDDTIDRRLDFLLKSTESLHATAQETTHQIKETSAQVKDMAAMVKQLSIDVDSVVTIVDTFAQILDFHQNRLDKIDPKQG